MAIIVSFDTTTLEALVATLVATEAVAATKEAAAFAPLVRPADEPDFSRRQDARNAAGAAAGTRNTALNALTAYIASIIV
jgi:hypothetical protein